jgi:hypothetical protein
MASPTFQVEDSRNRYDGEPKKRSPWFGCLIGCLVVLALGVVLVVLGGVWVGRNWKGLAAGGMSMAIKQEVDMSQLPPEEKVQIKVEIDRFTDSLNDPQISAEEFGPLMQSYVQTFMESPLIGTIMVSAAEQEQIDKSGLSDEEKEEARVTLRRFLRGTIDNDIPQADSQAAFQHIAVRAPNNRWQLKPSVTDEQLRAFVTEAKKAADDANVPEQPGPIDPSEEVKKAIDAALSWNAPNKPGAGGPGDVPPVEVPQQDQ